jgi:hypothetical protein
MTESYPSGATPSFDLISLCTADYGLCVSQTTSSAIHFTFWQSSLMSLTAILLLFSYLKAAVLCVRSEAVRSRLKPAASSPPATRPTGAAQGPIDRHFTIRHTVLS